MVAVDVRGDAGAIRHSSHKTGVAVGRRVRAVDGSHISEQGSTVSDWILHYSWEIFG